MDCEQLAPLYQEYARGALKGDARAELEAHLARGCPKCTPGVARARAVVAQHAQAPPDGKPSAQRPMFPVWAWIAAMALAIATGYTIRQMNNQNAQVAELRKQMRLAMLQNQALQNQLEQGRMIDSLMMSPDSRPLKLIPKDKNMPVVHAYLHPHMGVAITADEMPSVPPGRTLQLWFVPKKGPPLSIAIFRPDTAGQIALVAPVKMAMNDVSALAVTEEPAGGSPQPTASPSWTAQVN